MRREIFLPVSWSIPCLNSISCWAVASSRFLVAWPSKAQDYSSAEYHYRTDPTAPALVAEVKVEAVEHIRLAVPALQALESLLFV